MTKRRARASHVTPRPASAGRSVPTRRVAPDSRRVRQYRGLDARRRRAPIVTRGLLAIAVAGFGVGAFIVASGGIGPVLSTLGAGLANAISRLDVTPNPSPTTPAPVNSPVIASPAQAYTNKAQVVLHITLPDDAPGDETAKVRIYLALEGLAAAPVVDVPVASTIRLDVPFDLTVGRNDISATLFLDGIESEPSPIVTWILDQEPPKISISSPKNGAAILDPDVKIRGATQPATRLIARNDANGSSLTTVAAASDGKFEISLPLVAGANAIEIKATDPAGNESTATLNVIQGSAKMGVQLIASKYSMSVSNHPSSLQLTVLVTDPAGAPLAGASAFFTLQIPGKPPISNSVVTGADGRARFTTLLVDPISRGSGSGTVLVTSDLYGESTDRVSLTFVK